MEEQNLPLVSVPVVTYNSSATVIETLDSIYNQTYSNIELIVSDDCSTDNTVELCKNWIEQHKERFVRTKLLTVEKNTGVSANGNRARTACKGEWVKGIAGDDIMMPNCIEHCVDYVQCHNNILCLFGKQTTFYDITGERIENGEDVRDAVCLASPEQQLHYLIFNGNFLQAPTFFVRRDTFKKYNIQNDERIPMMEDWPKWINLLKAGITFYFFDEIIVKYRHCEQSLSTSSNPSTAYLKSLSKLFILYRFKPIFKEDKPRAIMMYIDAKHTLSPNLIWNKIFLLSQKIYKLYAEYIKKK